MDRHQAASTAVETTVNDVVRRVTSDPPTQENVNKRIDHVAAKTNAARAPLRHSKYRHTAAVHSKSRPSTLSHDATETPSFIGFRNLGGIVLIAGNLRLLIENIQKYGVLICVSCHDFRKQDLIVGTVLYSVVPACLLIAYLIELFAAYEARSQLVSLRKLGRTVNGGGSNKTVAQHKDGTTSPTAEEQARFRRTWYIIALLHFVNISFTLVLTSYVIYRKVNHPLIGTIVEIHAIIVWLKTASYALTNRDLRHSYLHPQTDAADSIPELYRSVPYPENVTFGNLAYFWWAPTLIYQPVYPRTDKIRWSFVLKRMGELVALCALMWVLSAQYAAPTLQNSLKAWEERDLTALLERVLKLSTVSLVIWLCGFFALFQSFLNALAEVTRFADRSFYDDWWNSDSLATYWRTWNKPVSTYFRRHLFSPLMARGYSYGTSAIIVFTASAVLHEMAVGLPTHNVIGVAFAGMMFQLPLIAITKRFERTESPTKRMIGNCIFWVTFTIFGQPFAALCYFYAWQIKFGSISAKWNAQQGNVAVGKQ